MTIDLSPDEFRRLGHQLIELIAAQLENIHSAPTRQPVPPDVQDFLLNPTLPPQPHNPDTLIEQFQAYIQPYPMGNNSPRFFAWVNSPAAPLGILAEMLAAAHNPSVAGGDHSATYLEYGILKWFKQMFGFTMEAGGLLVSGGSVANLVCMGAMRHWATAGKVRAEGMANQTLVVYTSTEGHSCILKAVEILGIGNQNLRHIPVNADYQMDMDALRQQIATDRANGLRPVCIAASAGTVNTGAIDPLHELADLCAAEGLWFHVDGAYGGVGILAEGKAALYAGIERADSIAIDPHKWLYLPIECGCALVKDGTLHREAFSVLPPYLRDDRGLPWFSEFGVQQTRTFRALKVWMVVNQIGEAGYRELITRDITLADSLAEKIEHHPDFALLAHGPLSIVCFRYAPSHAPTDQWEDLNRRLLEIVQREGQVFLTSTRLHGVLALRACIVNFRTTEADLDTLLNVVSAAGAQILAS